MAIPFGDWVIRDPFVVNGVIYHRARDTRDGGRVHTRSTGVKSQLNGKISRKAAADALRVIQEWIEARERRGSKDAIKLVPFNTALSEWHAQRPAHRRVKKTVKDWEYSLRIYKEYFGRFDVAEITFADFQRFVDDRERGYKKRGGEERDPASAATIKKNVGELRQFWRWCKRSRYAHEDVTEGVHRPPVSSVEHGQSLTLDEARALVQACTDSYRRTVEGRRRGTKNETEWEQEFEPAAWLRPFVIVALYSGLRRGEILYNDEDGKGLHWKNVDFQRRRLVFPSGAKSNKNRPDELPMHPVLERELRAWRAQGGVGPVFPGIGDPHDTFKRATARARSPAGFRLHDLRHTTSSWMEDAEVSESVNRKIMGHSMVGIPQRYRHPTWERLVAAIEGLPDVTTIPAPADAGAEVSS